MSLEERNLLQECEIIDSILKKIVIQIGNLRLRLMQHQAISSIEEKLLKILDVQIDNALIKVLELKDLLLEGIICQSDYTELAYLLEQMTNFKNNHNA